MWKPGQLVTIDRHVYRVTKNENHHCNACSECRIVNGGYACHKGSALRIPNKLLITCVNKSPLNCYLKFVK